MSNNVVPVVWPAQPRQTVQAHFADGKTYEGPSGTPLIEFIKAAYPDARCPIVAALVNNRLQELTCAVTQDVHVKPIDISTSDGMRIYHRSLCFLLIVAVHELFPAVRVFIDHSVTLGGVFCEIRGREPFNQAEIEAIEARMREIVEADLPLRWEIVSVQEAKSLFASQGYDDKVRLLNFREEGEIAVYCLRGMRDYFYGYMMPSTGQMRWFSLQLYPPGFILRLPSRESPTDLPRYRDYPKLMTVFREYGRWLNILGMEGISSLNRAVEAGEISKAILVSEALHEKHISNIADEIMKRQARLVFIAGPSASGKTTFARRLAVQLMANGQRPFAIGLDDYFLDRELTPRDEHGDYDFEALEAINLPLFHEQLLRLMAGESVQLQKYNFKTGKSEAGEHIRLSKDAIIIVEGIHGLNPKLVAELPAGSLYRIYVSALTQLNIDHHNRVPTTDTRLLRRIVRDARERNYPARATIERWDSVRRGEERSIFPYQENADVMFNSALAYELAVLKPFAEPLLSSIPDGTLEAVEAGRLLSFLRWVRPCKPDMVPDNSLLREFIGGSILSDFRF